MTYAEKLKDSRWLAKRREILERDNFSCQSCGDNKRVMHVHHEYYLPDTEPWNYPNTALVVLCDGCHRVEEDGRKNAYRNLNLAIADAGFTREDVEKMTWAFKNIKVLPIYSYILTSNIYRGITEAWLNFSPPGYVNDDDEPMENEDVESAQHIHKVLVRRLKDLEAWGAHG
jgi:hypothetical protein